MTITGIVLGAGSSRRLGRPKQSLPLGGVTVLGHAVAAAEASSLDDVVLVVGGAADEALDGVVLGRGRVAYNDRYGEGCASSLLTGLDASPDADAVMLLLGDVPLLPIDVIDTVVATARAGGFWGAVTEFRDGIGHPFVFAEAAFPTLRALHGDKAVWKLVDDDPTRRMERIPVDADLPADVDTWDDYLDLCERIGYRPPPGTLPA